MKITRLLLVFLGVVTTVAACSSHHVDTLEKYCEGIRGVDFQKKYEPIWSVIFSVSFDGDAIRNDFAKFLNDAHMQKAEGRIKRMAWRDGLTLHLVNLSSLFDVEPEKIIGEWRSGIEREIRGELKDEGDICLFGAAASLFDELKIHSMSSRRNSRFLDSDSVTTIGTDRKRRLGPNAL